MTGPSRRSLLGFLGLAVPAAAAASVSSAASPPPALTPITSAEYSAEMQAIGWRSVASLYGGKPQGVIEYGPDDVTAMWQSQNDVFRIRVRIAKSGTDFWERCSRYLFERGLREDA